MPTSPSPSFEAQVFIDQVLAPALALPSVPAGSDGQARRALIGSLIAAGVGDPEPVGTIEEIKANGVPSRLYATAAEQEEILVWLHGGGWTGGQLDFYDATNCALANRAGCSVLSVDYRLAPQHPYPAAVDDSWAATMWAASRYRRIAVGGDSAGGNLAAAIALRARDHDVALALQLLVYPALDFAAIDGPFYSTYRTRYEAFGGIKDFGAMSQDGIRKNWHHYIPDPLQRSERDASPLQADSVAGVAPAMIITAEHDILRQEGEDYARRLEDEGVPVNLVNYVGQVHGFYPMLGMLEDARDAVSRSAIALQQAWKTRH